MRRLRHQQSCSIINNGGQQYSKYGLNQQQEQQQQQQFSPLTQNLSFSELQHVTITPRDSSKDPLGVAERGKVGIPSSHSECSSNDSVEGSVESNTGIINGEKKGIKL